MPRPQAVTTAKLALVAAALLGAALLTRSCLPGETLEVTVPAGLSARETAQLLASRGVLSSPFFFRAAAKALGADRGLKPGTYRMQSNLGSLGAIRILSSGASLGLKVLVPEGFSARQIAERLESAGICGAKEFSKLAESRRLEGYLFPTTYFFEPGTPAERVIAKMQAEFKSKIEAEYAAASPKPRLTLHQLLTLASIIEREAVLNDEKPMIAAVYLNRMRVRMRLEADPTVQYALGRWKKGLTFSDLRTPSPYNTYVHYGLPPGPICSPGLDSFKAALRPAMTDAIYFVADNKGGHVFTSNHEDHLKAKKQFKKGLREIKERLRREAAAKS